jgi:hypothetical protein
VTASDEHWAVECDSYEAASAGSERVLPPVNMPRPTTLFLHVIIFIISLVNKLAF